MKIKFLSVFALTALFAVGCTSKEEQPETIEEKVEQVIEETKTEAENAGEELKQEVTETTEKVSDKVTTKQPAKKETGDFKMEEKQASGEIGSKAKQIQANEVQFEQKEAPARSRSIPKD